MRMSLVVQRSRYPVPLPPHPVLFVVFVVFGHPPPPLANNSFRVTNGNSTTTAPASAAPSYTYPNSFSTPRSRPARTRAMSADDSAVVVVAGGARLTRAASSVAHCMPITSVRWRKRSRGRFLSPSSRTQTTFAGASRQLSRRLRYRAARKSNFQPTSCDVLGLLWLPRPAARSSSMAWRFT